MIDSSSTRIDPEAIDIPHATPPNARLSRRRFNHIALGTIPGAAALANANRAERPSQDVDWLGEVQRPPSKPVTGTPKLKPLLIDDNGESITTKQGWSKRREALRRWWLEFLGPLRVDRPRPKLTVLKEDKVGSVVRQLVRYESEPGIPVEGYLLRPERIDKPAPGVVVLHSTVNHTIRQPAGVEGRPEKAFGLTLARQGMVAFCPKCFLWVGPGNYNQRVANFHKRHPKSKGMAKMLFDAQRGLDVLGSLPQVDPKRLGAVGHSLGAKEVLYLAAFDERVKATVSSEGGIGTTYSNWDAPWYLSKAIKADGFDHEHHELLGLIAPRSFLLVGGDSADGARSWPFIDAALPVYSLLEPDRRPRLGLFNHGKGHAVPPEAERRIEQWLTTYL